MAVRRTSHHALLLAGALIAASLAPFVPHLTSAEPLPPSVHAQTTCPVISGYVYYDVNDNGLREPGEPGIAGVPMQLKDAAGATAGLATTDGSGFYTFDRAQGGTPLLEEAHYASFPETVTDWAGEASIPQFDLGLGTLDSVVLTVSGEVTSAIRAESLDTEPQQIAAEVSGRITLEAPGREVSAVPLAHAGEFAATAHDGAQDFAGTSGHDFGSATASDSATATILDAASLAAYTGTGQVTVTARAAATSRTTGSGNVLNEIRTVAAAEVEVRYRYRPIACLDPGAYAIVEVAQPAGYGDGLETAGNQSAISGTRGSDAISVVLESSDLVENNFGELASSLQGCVYVDANENGRRESGEAGISGVTVTLSGATSSTASTGGDGCYLFPKLPPGNYSISETQPPGFRDCRETIGSQGGQVGNDRLFDIHLGANVHGHGNNFGECLVATPAATPTPATTVSSSAPGTPTPTQSATGTPPRPTPSPSPPDATAVSENAPTPPGAPGAGTGLFGRRPDARIVIAGFAIFAASGWIAFLALGRARDMRE